MKLPLLEKRIAVPDGVNVKIDRFGVEVSGEKGKLKREFYYPRLSISLVEENEEDKKGKVVVLSCKNATKRDKMFLGTFAAHIKNMMIGVSKGFVYKLKVCSTHFPMNVSLKDSMLVVKNFLGEKVPRTLNLPKDVKVKIDGSYIVVEGIDKAHVGNVAGQIEKLTRITDKDRRRFQDGIYIVEKAGKSIV